MAKRRKSVRRPPAALKAPKTLKRAPEEIDLKEENTTLRRELAEALESEKATHQQQTATAEVLKIISRSTFDLQTVLDTLTESACHLCDAFDAVLFMREGESLSFAAHYGPIPIDLTKWPLTRAWTNGRAVVDRKPIHVHDLQAEKTEFPDGCAMAQRMGHRTSLSIPLLRGEEAIGSLTVRRTEIRPFSAKQIELAETFADQAVIAIENARLFDEVRARTEDLRESLQQQTATADVLKVISRSAFNIQTVLDTLVESAANLCQAENVQIFLRDGEVYRLAAYNGFSPEYQEYVKRHPIAPGRGTLVARTALEVAPVHIPDVLADPEYTWHEGQRLAGFRAMLGVPLVREGSCVGVMAMTRMEPRPFTIRQIELVTTFADQAVIAIENARLFDEVRARTEDLRESLQQQTATADVLKVISRSTFDLPTVLQTLVESAARLCEADKATITRQKDDLFFRAESYGFSDEFTDYVRTVPIVPDRGSAIGRALLEGTVIQIPDVQADADYTFVQAQRLGGFRTVLAVPMLREGVPIGAIGLTRSEVRPFTEKQIELVTTFADQAAIAIENVRLFEEVQAKTRDLSEALVYQTGSGNILKVIASSPTDVGPVLKAIVESACELCGAYDAIVRLKDGNHLVPSAHHGPIPTNEDKWAIKRSSVSGRAVIDKEPVHVHDMQSTEGDEFLESKKRARDLGHRTILSVPLLREGGSIGAIILRRNEVQPFSDKQIALLQTFADQAVIAIENTRLFNETKEALERQTATANILKVIAGSPTDVQPVFDAIAESAKRLLASHTAVVTRVIDDVVHLAASTAESEAPAHAAQGLLPYPLSSDRIHARVARTGQISVNTDAPNSDLPQEIKEFARTVGWRSMLVVPMLRNEIAIGTIGITRREPGSFDDETVDLLKTFADQAVIAIENARLFNETQEALDRQTATADILKVIASSPDDVQPVFEAIAERSNRLIEGLSTAVYSIIDDTQHLMAFTRSDPEADAALQASFPRPLSVVTWGDRIRNGEIVQVPDFEATVEWAEQPALRKMARLRGFRGVLLIPLQRDGATIGVISVTRKEPGAFVDHHVQLLQTFADQAVIAISNVELFQQVQERTRELSRSLDDLRAAQDRLIQTEKLASLGQLTAGIAHEIKNPLNFVNNFSALSAELTDELNDLLKLATLTDQMREEVEDLTRLLKENLDKVVQHGKRADAIVKNMLLHSRQGSGEHRRVDVNALVEESLNLAYHGARAEKQGFNITLKRSFDRNAGEIDVFPQEITRVLLNLISNGFYAATKRKAEVDGNGYEPTLAAATKNLGDSVEIRIRDSGIGIPPEVREKMFNPFFTTKPAGEGTGLGLSLSYDIRQATWRVD
jgi:GAF domain-containing protein